MDAYHRTQLKTIWKRKRMKNRQVYQLSKAKQTTQEIKEQRWRMFGHTLRLHHQTPAQKAMTYYFEEEPQKKKFKGRPRTTLP